MLFTFQLLYKSSLVGNLIILHLRPLVVLIGLIYGLIIHTSCYFDHNSVCFLVIATCTRDINVFIDPLVMYIFPEMSFSMKKYSLFLQIIILTPLFFGHIDVLLPLPSLCRPLEQPQTSSSSPTSNLESDHVEDSNQSTSVATNDIDDYVVSEHPQVQCHRMHTRLQDNIQKPK